MVAGPVIQRFDSLPEDISLLVQTSRDEGHDLVERLVDDWKDGSNRFDRPGEAVYEARLGAHLVGVGGLNRDPYIDDPDVGRIRHLYVSPDVRGRGVGRGLVNALVDHASIGFTRVRLRTSSHDSSRFYIALGFQETPDEPDATHGWWFWPICSGQARPGRTGAGLSQV